MLIFQIHLKLKQVIKLKLINFFRKCTGSGDNNDNAS
jgi:hypothetical protein